MLQVILLRINQKKSGFLSKRPKSIQLLYLCVDTNDLFRTLIEYQPSTSFYSLPPKEKPVEKKEKKQKEKNETQKHQVESEEIELWSEKVADDVIARHKEPYVVEGMWTPSGFFHIGNARPEVFTPYAVRRAIEDKGKKVSQNFILDDFDAVRKIPQGLGIKPEDEKKYIGFPCATAPSPIPGFKTWAEAFVSQLKKFAPNFGLDLNFISAYDTYNKGKLNDLILLTLDQSEEIAKVCSCL